MGMRWKYKFILFHNLYSPNMIKIIEEDQMNRHAACMGGRRNG
jgi:hypothetical protein